LVVKKYEMIEFNMLKQGARGANVIADWIAGLNCADRESLLACWYNVQKRAVSKADCRFDPSRLVRPHLITPSAFQLSNMLVAHFSNLIVKNTNVPLM